MASLVLINGIFFIEFLHSKFEENNDQKRLLFVSNDKIISGSEEGFEIVSKEPFVISLLQNPKSFHDFIIINKINSIVLELKNSGIIKEHLKLDIKFHTEFDSVSYVQNIEYNKPKTAVAFTHVFNETEMIKLWVKYYGRIFGNENLYVIDHGSTNNFKSTLPNEVNVVTIPRGNYDNWNISKYCAYFQRFLLTQYEWVIHTDCDEFLMCSEDNDFNKLFSQFKGENLTPNHAYDVLMDTEKEIDLNYDDLILKQRSKMLFNHSFLKTAITSTPTTWAPGFHKCYDRNIKIDNLWLFHLKLTDFKQTFKRCTHIWQTLNQTELDKKFFKLKYDDLYQAKNIDVVKNTISMNLANSIDIPEWSKLYL